jgi:hypothetical protein
MAAVVLQPLDEHVPVERAFEAEGAREMGFEPDDEGRPFDRDTMVRLYEIEFTQRKWEGGDALRFRCERDCGPLV